MKRMCGRDCVWRKKRERERERKKKKKKKRKEKRNLTKRMHFLFDHISHFPFVHHFLFDIFFLQLSFHFLIPLKSN